MHTPYAAFYWEEKKCRGQQTDSISLLWYTKDSMSCQTVKTYTSRIVICPPYEFLDRCYVCGVCVQACVVFLYMWLCMNKCVCPHFSVYSNPCLWVHSMSAYLTNLQLWSIRFTEVCTSVDLLNGNMLQKLLHFMRHDDGFMAQGGPWGFPWAPTRKHFPNCVLPWQVGVSELVSLTENSSS